MFRPYNKIHRLGKEETDGILVGKCTVQEKIDGANTSIWFEGGEVHCGSRTQELKDSDFNGFVSYVHSNPQILNLVKSNQNCIFYGEWLVRHTISYKETAYKKWYLFDIFNIEQNWYLPQSSVEDTAKQYGLNYPQVFGVFDNPTIEQIESFAGKTNLGEKGEGVVIKNLDFVDKFGNCHYAKVVTQEFKENNGIVFGGNNKHSDTYWEMYVVNKYITLERVQKIMHKIQPQINKRLDMEHIPRIMGSVYHDMITEEIWEIQSKVPKLDLKKLKHLCERKIRQIYIDIINDTVSVADRKN